MLISVVIVCIVPWVRAGRAEILYIRRTTNPRDPWSGQVSYLYQLHHKYISLYVYIDCFSRWKTRAWRNRP
jgi:hypothetical protein